MEIALTAGWTNMAPISVAQKRERFESIAREQQGVLLRIAKHYCRGNEALAQDLVQDALVNGYKSYLDGGFKDGTNAKAWLVRILTNLFLNDNRRRKKFESGAEVREDLAASSSYEPDATILESLLDGPVEESLAKLPEHQRMCVVLVDIEGLDYAEAATILECPVGTVRSRLARGRSALFEDLYDYAKARGIVR